MADTLRMKDVLHPDERLWLARILQEPLNDLHKQVYADWLEERGDARGEFLRQYVAATQSLDPAEFPNPKKMPEEWLELIGFRLLKCAADHGGTELKEPLLKLARPALRMVKEKKNDNALSVGASKIGGHPDLPPGVAWPRAEDCKASYNDTTEGVEEPAQFLAQINLADIAATQAAPMLPATGLLSFFGYQDYDNPDVGGVMAVLHPAGGLVRADRPEEMAEGNDILPARRLTFLETLDIPYPSWGPWEEDLQPWMEKGYEAVWDEYHGLNFENMFGYGRATSGGDPTPNKQSRHLIVLAGEYEEGWLHIQIPADQLAAHNFAAIILAWVDYD